MTCTRTPAVHVLFSYRLSMDSVEESRLIGQVVDRLARAHSGWPDHLVAEAVTLAHARFVGSRIR